MPRTTINRPALQCSLLCALAPLLIAWAALGLGLCRMPGVRVGAVALPVFGAIEPALERRALLWNAQSLVLQVGQHVFQPARAELGWALRVEDAQRELRELGRSANPLLTWHALATGLFGAGCALHWTPRLLHANLLTRYVERLRAEIDRLPVPGSYAPDGSLLEGLAGEALDSGATRRAIERALMRSEDRLEVASIVTPPPQVYRHFIHPEAATQILMMSQETAFRPNTGRATNIELAAHKLDGTLLLPGAAFSFNALVGKREAARGFAPALELAGGELVEGIGGGVCQVAGTVHAAAFFAGLTVDEYHAHSRLNRFAYLRPGLDAMVAWPEEVRELRDTKDLRLRNPYPFPVRFKVTIVPGANQSLVRVQLYGAAKPFRVDFQFAVLKRVPATELRRIDPTLAAGETRVQQTELEGLVIARRRTIYTPERRIEEETRVAYPPTPRILLVGTGSGPSIAAGGGRFSRGR